MSAGKEFRDDASPTAEESIDSYLERPDGSPLVDELPVVVKAVDVELPLRRQRNEPPDQRH